MSRGEKGHILVHVLITAVIIVVIMASMARMILARYAAYARHQTSDQGARYAASGVNRLLTVWADKQVECYNPASDANYSSTGYTCSPASTTPPGAANCKCCPTDRVNDAAVTFMSGGSTQSAQLCVETPNGDGTYHADTTSGVACPSITCP